MMLRWTQTLVNTLREAPQDAEIVSHKLMIRAGMLRKLGGGLYTYMPLGMRALRKVEAIVREEMARAGAQETLFPILQPAELWKQTGRWETMGAGMFRVQDRKEAWYVLAPTAEEAFTALAKNEISSYRQLPCIIYQMQDKFRVYAVDKDGAAHGQVNTIMPQNDGKQYIVTSGLEEGTEIVAEGATMVKEDQVVKNVK